MCVHSLECLEYFTVFSLAVFVGVDPFCKLVLKFSLALSHFVLAEHLYLAFKVLPSVGETCFVVCVSDVDGLVDLHVFVHDVCLSFEHFVNDRIEAVDVVVDAV